MEPSRGKGGAGGAGDGPGRRNIGTGKGRAAASTRRNAVRIALCHELIRAGRLLDRRGMIVAMEGNLSARLGDKTMVITRRDFVEMTFDASEDSPERREASTEHRMHLAAYIACPDVDALVHAHPISLTAFALRGVVPDFSRFDEARLAVGTMAFVEYRPSGSVALAEGVGRALAAAGPGPTRPNVILLGNHGALALGANVDQALGRLETAEHLAATLLAAERE
jgi:L-fuculose-phosphate aldolase